MPRAFQPSPNAPPQKPIDGEEDGFVTVENVPIFDEHETEEAGPDGKPQKIKYTADILGAIAEGMNAKIRDTGDYVALVNGHTPDPGDANAKDFKPELMGWAGPFTVGEIGREKPRKCILARFRYFKDKAHQAMRLPRRSVEIWQEPRLEDRTIDPIALLGAEAPRRSLGLVYTKYSRLSGQPVAVARYTACMPGGANTFIPGHDDKKKQYAKESSMDVQEFLAAFEQSDMGQWIKKQMAAEAAQPSVEPQADPNVAAMQKYAEAGDVDGASAHMQGLAPAAVEKMRAHYEKEEDENTKEFYGKVAAKYQAPVEDEKEKAMYSKGAIDLKLKYSKLESEVAALKAAKEASEKKAVRAERYSRLNEFRMAGVQLDPDQEIEDVAEMTEQQWGKHQTRIAEKYQKAPMGVVLPSIKGNPGAKNDQGARVDRCNRAEANAKAKGTSFRTELALLENGN